MEDSSALCKLIPVIKNNLNLPNSHRPICFKKIKTTTTTDY